MDTSADSGGEPDIEERGQGIVKLEWILSLNSDKFSSLGKDNAENFSGETNSFTLAKLSDMVAMLFSKANT